MTRPSWLEVNKRRSKRKDKRDMLSFIVQIEVVEGDTVENVENAVADARVKNPDPARLEAVLKKIGAAPALATVGEPIEVTMKTGGKRFRWWGMQYYSAN